MKNLKENSIRISDTIVACWPQFGDTEETIDVTDIKSKFNDAYSANNSTICFVVDHEVFVTPYTTEAMSTLERAGLARTYFYVPFSNGDYPKYQKDEWLRLREAVHELFYRDCAKWCEEHGIGKLSEDVLKCCFKMPREGAPVRHPHFEAVYYPICNERYINPAVAVNYFNDTVVNKLGRYCTNNGKVVFVYCDGRTYIAKGNWILDELHHAGYKESSLFVPFSNGEQITDEELAAQWEQIPKKISKH